MCVHVCVCVFCCLCGVQRDNSNVDPTESRLFWFTLYLTPVVWGLLGFASILKLNFQWFIVTLVAIVLSSANLVGLQSALFSAKAVQQGMFRPMQVPA